ncbi:glycoside hydrolase family 3 protein [bacterium]|nr:glycoside hydrolase family 3 protein [bacterium]
MEKFVYQMFILGSGEYLKQALEKGLGGVIFFTPDIKSEEQFKTLIQNVKQESLIPPFLSIDQEGGRVERTENIRPKRLSARYAFEKGEEFLVSQTQEIASELKEYGINLNFAPVADVNTNPDNPIIGERAFSDNPDEVIRGVNLVSNVYRSNGIIPCIKHYPGHGDANADSHKTLPKIDLSMEYMEKIHIKPFRNAVENNIEMVMAAHLHCSCFDKETIPASLSKNAIGYLRNTLKYDGVVISDDMVMKGVQAYGSFEAVKMGIEAGLDMFIFRNADKNAFETIEKLVRSAENDKTLAEKIIKSNDRIQKLKNKYCIL